MGVEASILERPGSAGRSKIVQVWVGWIGHVVGMFKGVSGHNKHEVTQEGSLGTASVKVPLRGQRL